MMLRYAFGLEEEAVAVERAIAAALQRGYRTADIYCGDGLLVGTSEMGDQITTLLKAD